MTFRNVKGTKDISFDQYSLFSSVITIATEMAKRYGFEGIQTPVMEYKNLFLHTLGEDSDVISKEMYSFPDRNGEEIVLRPEFTASIARSFVNSMQSLPLPQKLFSYGPLFRYERPQKGRLRQFHQLNYEVIGGKSYNYDVEIILLADALLKNLSISDYIIEINSLGTVQSRRQYLKALKDFLIPYESSLSKDSRRRLHQNPLRILDSKDEKDLELLANAPIISDYYDEESKDFFDSVLYMLDDLKVKYTVNHNIVRGLDYYSHTVFECTHNMLGSQSAILAGGRYNHLVSKLGGTETHAVGFASGIERLLLLTQASVIKKDRISVLFLQKEPETLSYVFRILSILRMQEMLVDCCFDKSFKNQLQIAAKNSRLIVIVGEDELTNNFVSIKDLHNTQQYNVSIDEMVSCILKVLYAT